MYYRLKAYYIKYNSGGRLTKNGLFVTELNLNVVITLTRRKNDFFVVVSQKSSISSQHFGRFEIFVFVLLTDFSPEKNNDSK